MFCMQLWLKWREIWKEWKKELNISRHYSQDAFSDFVCSLSKIDWKWFAWCSCKSECKLHYNQSINELSIFIVLIFNINEWFAAINNYVDLKALDIKVLSLHKFLSFNDVNLWNVKNQLQALMNSNLKWSMSWNSLLKTHYEWSSKESTFIWIMSIWKIYHMWIFKKFTSIHVEKWMKRKMTMKKEIVMSTMHVDFACVNENHNVKNMQVSSWKDLRQMKDERFSQCFWLVSMSSTLISVDSSDIIDALNIASSSTWNNLNHRLFDLYFTHLKEFIKLIVKERDSELNQIIQEARNAVNCFMTALLNALIHHYEESCWFNDHLLKLDALISRTATCQFFTKYVEQYQAQIQQWKNQALTNLEYLQMQWNKNSRL